MTPSGEASGRDVRAFLTKKNLFAEDTPVQKVVKLVCGNDALDGDVHFLSRYLLHRHIHYDHAVGGFISSDIPAESRVELVLCLLGFAPQASGCSSLQEGATWRS